MIDPGSTETKALAHHVSRMQYDAAEGWMRTVCNRAEINRLRKDFIEYATHKPDCRGGDGERCACGYLDAYALIKSE